MVGARVVLATAEEIAEGMTHFAGSDLAAALDAMGSCFSRPINCSLSVTLSSLLHGER